MICPRCGADSQDPDQPVRYAAFTRVLDDRLENFVRLACDCGWEKHVNTDELRTEGQAAALAAVILEDVEGESAW